MQSCGWMFHAHKNLTRARIRASVRLFERVIMGVTKHTVHCKPHIADWSYVPSSITCRGGGASLRPGRLLHGRRARLLPAGLICNMVGYRSRPPPLLKNTGRGKETCLAFYSPHSELVFEKGVFMFSSSLTMIGRWSVRLLGGERMRRKGKGQEGEYIRMTRESNSLRTEQVVVSIKLRAGTALSCTQR